MLKHRKTINFDMGLLVFLSSFVNSNNSVYLEISDLKGTNDLLRLL